MKVIFVSRRFERTAFDLAACDPDELVMMVDIDRCISCGACGMACRIEHGEDAAHPGGFRPITVASDQRAGTRTVFLPLACRHCTAPCEYYSQYNFWITCPADRERHETSPACDSCARRTEAGLWPACATRCSMKTIYFGAARDMNFVLREKRLGELGDVRLTG